MASVADNGRDGCRVQLGWVASIGGFAFSDLARQLPVSKVHYKRHGHLVYNSPSGL
jgi:hypothetical protein